MTLQNVTWGITAHKAGIAGTVSETLQESISKSLEAVLHIDNVPLSQFVSELCLCLFQANTELVWELQALVPAPLLCTEL